MSNIPRRVGGPATMAVALCSLAISAAALAIVVARAPTEGATRTVLVPLPSAPATSTPTSGPAEATFPRVEGDWDADAGEDLAAAYARWAPFSRYAVATTSVDGHPLPSAFHYHGDFEGAVSGLARSVGGARVTMYEGARTVFVRGAGDDDGGPLRYLR